MYCHSCGKEIHNEAVICVHCGVPLKGGPMDRTIRSEENRGLVALILMLPGFAGFCGLHRFYTGHIVSGVIQLLTVGVFFIWWTIDLILLLSGNFKDKEGNRVLIRF